MYYYAIILASLIFAGIYDYHIRHINDLVWIPSVIATGIFLIAIPELFVPIITRILIIFIIGFILSYFNFIGQADVIAFLFAFSDSYSLASPFTFLFILACVTFINLVYVYYKFKPTQVSVSELKRKPHWVPVSLDNIPLYRNIKNRQNILSMINKKDEKIPVIYGHPFVLYIAEAYLIYLIYLFLYQYQFIVQTP